LNHWLATAALACKKKDIVRIGRSLYEFPARELVPVLMSGSAATNPVLGSTHALLQALAKSTLDAERFLRAFALAALHSVRIGTLDDELLLQILFGKLNKNGERDTWQLLIFLDIADAADSRIVLPILPSRSHGVMQCSLQQLRNLQPRQY